MPENRENASITRKRRISIPVNTEQPHIDKARPVVDLVGRMHDDEQQRADQHGSHDMKALDERGNQCSAKRELLHERSHPQHQHDKNDVRPPVASAELFGRPSQFCNNRRNNSRETQCHRDHDKTQARSHEVSVSISSTPAKSPRITDFQQRLGYVERVPNRPCRCQQISGEYGRRQETKPRGRNVHRHLPVRVASQGRCLDADTDAPKEHRQHAPDERRKEKAAREQYSLRGAEFARRFSSLSERRGVHLPSVARHYL